MRRIRLTTYGLCAWLMVVCVGPAKADKPLFVWADEHANLHVTDRLADVPEPYHTIYAKRLEKDQLSQKHDNKTAAAEGTDAAQIRYDNPESAVRDLAPHATAEIEKRRGWQKRFVDARNELTQATQVLAGIEQKILEKNRNPILRLTPVVKKELAELDANRIEAQSRVLNARRMLLETLPQQARQAQVPVQWIQ